VVAVAHGEMVKKMSTWNSPLSMSFDILFGVLPCILIVSASFFALLIYGPVLLLSVLSPESLTPPEANAMIAEPSVKESLELFPMAICSLIAGLMLIIVTIVRQKSTRKSLVILSLLLSLGFAFFTTYSYAEVGFKLFLALPAIVAIKHIIMLTRGNE
jgi:hypothetical protein